VGDAIRGDGLDARITENDFVDVFGRRVAFEGCLDVVKQNGPDSGQRLDKMHERLFRALLARAIAAFVLFAAVRENFLDVPSYFKAYVAQQIADVKVDLLARDLFLAVAARKQYRKQIVKHIVNVLPTRKIKPYLRLDVEPAQNAFFQAVHDPGKLFVHPFIDFHKSLSADTVNVLGSVGRRFMNIFDPL
jgi:hypothetical protein